MNTGSIIILVISYLGFALCNMKMPPQQPPKPGSGSNGMVMMAPPIRILRMKSNSDVDGNYNYMYESENGIKMQEQGFVKQGEKKEDQINVAQGSYSYTSPEGQSFTVNYIADENGFQVLDSDDMTEMQQQQQESPKQRPPKQQQPPPMTTMRPSSQEIGTKTPYINDHILRLGSAQQFYRFFDDNKQPEETDEGEVSDQYENY